MTDDELGADRRRVNCTWEFLTGPRLRQCSAAARVCLLAVSAHLDYGTGVGRAAIGAVARAMGTSPSYAVTCLRELVTAQAIERLEVKRRRNGAHPEAEWRLLPAPIPNTESVVTALTDHRQRVRKRHVRLQLRALRILTELGLCYAAVLLLAVITTYAKYGTGEGWVSWGRLARDLDMHPRTVRSLAKKLADAGVVVRFNRGKKDTGEDEECGWRIIMPELLPAALTASPSPAPTTPAAQTSAPRRAHIPLLERNDQDPDRSATPTPDHTPRVATAAEVDHLIEPFARGRGWSDYRASGSDRAFARQLIAAHGLDGATAIVEFAVQKMFAGACTFCAVKVYVAEALAAGVVERATARSTEAAIRSPVEAELDRSAEPPPELLERLTERMGKEDVAAMKPSEKWELIGVYGIDEDYLEARLRALRRNGDTGTVEDGLDDP